MPKKEQKYAFAQKQVISPRATSTETPARADSPTARLHGKDRLPAIREKEKPTPMKTLIVRLLSATAFLLSLARPANAAPPEARLFPATNAFPPARLANSIPANNIPETCAPEIDSPPSITHGKQEATLTVYLSGIPHSEGQVIIGVYNKEEGAFSTTEAYRYQFRPSQKGQMKFEFSLPKGSYAVGAYVDANKNGKLDANMLGIPKEYYGLSNNITLPNFRKAALPVVQDTAIRIEMHKF